MRAPRPLATLAVLLLAPLAASQAVSSHQQPVQGAWQPLAPLPGAGPQVFQILEPTACAYSLHYASSSAGLLVSHDGGLSWSKTPAKPGEPTWESRIAVSPADADVVLFTPRFGPVRRTTDAGGSWSVPTGIPADGWFLGAAYAPADPALAYATAYLDGIYRSLDGGESFTRVFPYPAGSSGFSQEIEVDAADALHAYHLTFGELYVTTDGGDNWTGKAVPDSAHFDLAVDANDADRLLVGGRNDAFLSTDGGDSWTALGLPEFVDTVAFDPLLSDRFYAYVRFVGAFLTDDAGATWTGIVDDGLDADGGSVGRFLPSPNDPDLLLLAAEGGVFRSVDRGATFAAANDGLESFANVRALAVDPFDPEHLVVATGGRAFVSFDGGASFVESGGIEHFKTDDVVADPAVEGRFYTFSAQRDVLRSDDGGLTFVRTSSEPGWRLETHPAGGGRLFLTGIAGDGLRTSDDGGATWSPTSITGWCWAVEPSPVDPSLVYCSTSSEILVSEDGGATFAPAAVSPPGIARDVQADPFVADRAWAASDGAGLFKSDDRGQTWTQVAPGVGPCTRVHVAAGFAEILFANDFFESKASFSTDGGATSVDLSGGLPTLLRSFASGPLRLYAGTNGSGAFRLRRF